MVVPFEYVSSIRGRCTRSLARLFCKYMRALFTD